MDKFLGWFDGVPNPVIYLGLGAGAGLENIVPAIPGDTLVALGGVLSSAGDLSWGWVLAAVWVGNVATGMGVYRLGYVKGAAFFEKGSGRKLVNRRQLRRVRRFYERYGVPAIFLARFLPGLRAVVPVFAGVSLVSWRSVAAPLALASAIWYGALVGAGAYMGARLDRLGTLLEGVNRTLAAVAVAVALLVAWWWWRTRRRRSGSVSTEPRFGAGEADG